MKALAVLTLCSFSLVLNACVSSGGSGSQGGDRYLITRDQILDLGAVNVLDAVRKIQPGWLPRERRTFLEIGLIDGSRGDRPVSTGRITEGQGIGGDAGELLWWEEVSEIRFLREGEAGQALGSCSGGCRGAVIVRLGAGRDG
jgi:hypothetical protein